MTRPFDAIIIGSGQAGPFLAERLTRAGQTVALIEREHLGGTCVNDGCIPTKTLVASARVAHLARRAADYGVMLGGPVRVDMAKVKARKDAVVQASIDGLTSWLENMERLTLIRGEARFEGPHAVSVNGETLTAPKIFINAGGRPVIPDWPGLADIPYLTNTGMMGLDALPEHLIVVGGSYIGLEFAQMYRRFGAAVTVLEYGDRLIAREDPEISQAVRAMLEAEGIVVHTGVRDFAVRPDAAGLRLTATGLDIPGSHLLLAIGRLPNSDGLDLAAAGVETDARGYIKVDDRLRTNVDGVWALGDINGRGAFTHTSYNDFEIVAANLLDDDPRQVSDRIPAYALFTDPPLGRVGMTEAEVRAAGRPALVGVMPMTRVGRAKERGETTGFMKVLVDAQTQRILGAALLCIEGDEIVHSLLDVMAADAPYTVIQRSVHIHPTVSELIPTLLGQLKPLD
ncbi:pyruvate/2-oxoglutarate dehydrogenase complex dihydrolipoamide dehydrogenase (E3) component [Caulobacter ginsengisoli]|uniref:Pyruvate/2-oxoglutarate dehydrogenase complex dihydrolipoamide dehydrogenase (E3) component n=1 Tax=Caulobacter ginsengisoli TaxID=400775 RepID=A0ABU0IXY2_9CAUL|nr:FAD-containing oxidoreductase [Caulobacter ginsengisoli]MDQ0466872.1 pyruvate/2-oxoglutarate dehydrogenase complex dihydrolipoamide dehydrogenase (E3) component [Caulobacter ginsengisoli]